MSVKVFVYGTLKRGERNHGRMAGASLLGAAVTKAARFSMAEYDSISLPGRVTPDVSEGGSLRIAGELYEVSDELLAALDEFETVGVHYLRQTVELEDGHSAEMYLHLPASPRRPRPGSSLISRRGNVACWSELGMDVKI